jgi:hypothetical protein
MHDLVSQAVGVRQSGAGARYGGRRPVAGDGGGRVVGSSIGGSVAGNGGQLCGEIEKR